MDGNIAFKALSMGLILKSFLGPVLLSSLVLLLKWRNFVIVPACLMFEHGSLQESIFQKL
jgi:hypothetical protein